MKGNENTSGIIKIPDVSAVASVAQQQQLQQPVFVQRPQQQQQQQPPHIELTSRPCNVTSAGAAQITLPRGVVSMSPAQGVTVYRSDTNSVSNPPLAHSGGVAISTTPSGLSSSQPPVAHHTQATIVGQQTPLKPEQITLPTTPVSLPYGTAVTTTYSGAAPTSIKTLTGGVANQQQNSVHSQIIHQKQPAAHQNFPIRTIASLSNAAINSAMPSSGGLVGGPNSGAGNANFQRLKVEDALSYLDQVKYKFGNQPQVYNDFLDIMKEFKSQSIDTPGVIARVSCLFKGHPELIVGFNTFLPPGYKIEVQCNDAIAVSMPGILGAGMQTIVHTPHGIQTMAPQGQLTSITTAQAASLAASTTVRPVTIQTNNSAGQKFQTTVIKGSAEYPGHPLRLGSEVSLVPQGGPLNQQHLLTTANLQPQQQPQQQQQLPQQQQQQPQQGQPHNQPVEFNHAINYVNKIKNRFAGQPDVYKQFLEILHTYQKDQRAIKDGHQPTGRYLTESEVFAQVAKLFQNQEDLLNEFSQFLPEATNDNSLMGSKSAEVNKRPLVAAAASPLVQPGYKYSSQQPPAASRYQPQVPASAKRPPTGLSHPPPKKAKYGALRNVSLAEAGKFGTLNEYAFFDKVRKALKSKEVYEDFLRCLVLFNQEVISRTELVQLAVPFLSRYPELFKWFKDFVGYKESAAAVPAAQQAEGSKSEALPPQVPQRFSGDSAMDIDYATCKRLGASYCALPKSFVQPTCTGRTSLCREVLNDTWVSFPSWSEDSQFVTSRKTQYEEFIYRTEDERFEFDVVLETNKDTIKVLEVVQKKMSRMPPEEAARYRLDDCLGGSSPTIHQRAIRRIYGDKANDIIDGLKRNPVVAVPLVLRRLKSKDEEWREVQKNFNKTWRDQNEKYYLKSLDHQSLLFKQSDTRFLRSKSLLNELETLYDERHEQEEANANASADSVVPVPEGPHMTLDYADMQILDDVNNLLIHHVKRQTSIHKEDKHKIKVLLKHFLMDLFKHPRQEMSEDEREDDEDSEKDEGDDPDASNGSKSTRAARKKKTAEDKKDATKKDEKKELINEADIKVEPNKDGRRTPLHAREMEPDESYSHIMCNNNWCLFLRLHNILSERLTKMYNQAVIIANEETKDRKDRKESIAVALRLKPKNEIEPEDYYPAFLDMVKNLLDGNMDAQAYEDTLREMFGIHAYVSFTLDKVVSNAVRQLQHLVMDESCVDCYDLYLNEKKNGATGGFCSSAADRQLAELVYQKRSEKLLADENCFKIFIYHQSGKMTIELLDTETEGHNSDQDEESARKYSSYVDRFIQPGDEISDECKVQLTRKPVFLPRSIRSYNQSPYGKMREMQNHLAPPDKDANNGVSKESSPSAKKELFNDKSDVSFEDNLQCKFNPRNFKILYVINSENCFYRRLALTRAKNSHKSVSQRKFRDFGRWHSKWLKKNVPETSVTSINEWFMGKSEGLVANKTHKITRADMERTPYRTFHKYKADIIKTTSNNSNGPVPASTTASHTSASSAAVTGSSSASSTATAAASMTSSNSA